MTPEKDGKEKCGHNKLMTCLDCGFCGECFEAKDAALKEARAEIENLMPKAVGYEAMSEKVRALQKELSESKDRVAVLEKLVEWCKQDTSDAMKWKRELETEITALKAEVNRLSNIIRDEGWAIPDGALRLGLVTAKERIKSLEEAVEAARKALKKYGVHFGCAYSSTRKCKCGLEEALARLDGSGK